MNGKRFKVNVIDYRCKECGLCIAMCPTRVLERGSVRNNRGFRYPVARYVERCIGCKMCEYVCPDIAIFVTEERV
ncbi:MAG: 4Fe-4S dicluster domain-containing protein [Sulfolobales archaeon]